VRVSVVAGSRKIDLRKILVVEIVLE